MAVKILDNISIVQAVPAVNSEIFRDVSKPLSFYIVGAGTAPTWSATITFYEIDNVGYKKTGKSVSFAVSNLNKAELYTWTSSVTSFVAHVSSISNASVTVYMTQAVDSALERILLTEPSSGTKAMPSDIVGCAAEYVPGQGWIGNLGVLDSKAVLDSFPTNALVPGKVWAVVASASSFAKYNYMSAGWALESSVGPTGSSNIQGSPSNPFASTTERDAWATNNPGELLSGGRTKRWTIVNGAQVEQVWTGPGAGDWAEIIFPVINLTKIRSGLNLYDVQNDLFSRETAIHVHPEALVPLSAGPVSELSKIRLGGKARFKIKRSQGNSANKNIETISIPVTGRDWTRIANCAVSLTTIKLSSVPATSFRPVFIGNSIVATAIKDRDGAYTASYGIASALSEFFVRDAVDGLGGSCTVLGTTGNATATTQYRGSARTLRSFHEGRPGWAAATYLRHPVLLTASSGASTASSANGAASWAFLGKVASVGAWTGSDSQKNTIRTTYFSNSTAWDYNSDLWEYLKLRPGWGGGLELGLIRLRIVHSSILR